MSTTVDERVVEMRFDNKQFEQNIQTSLSSLDKLKKSLNLEGAAKGLETVNDAANKCSGNMSPLSNAVETVRVRFSALEVMAITALQNITNSALAAGKNLVSAFTIDPIKSGFEEYETQINAVQTILANTSSKGTTLDQVNNALDELNHYADMTIYNFTEMTRNIGTFTAAGVDLDTSVAAIKGIANLAAVSGSNSQQASTAMYQLSQALAAGTVKLQDWNSVVNAGMGGQVFQDALKETAKVHGIAIDEMIKDEGSFRETLSKGWLTSDILTETLAKFTGDLNEDQLRTMGYTDDQIKSIMEMGKTANDAATKVKTFTQLFDTLKEAAQSGWTQSWEIIVGDFEEAKELLTEVSDTFSAVINASADARNKMLQDWKDLGGRTMMIEAVKNGDIKHFFLVGGCDGARVGRNYYTEFVKQSPADSIILTLACGKYRFNDLDLGTIGGLPRIMDMGQCNDAYSAIKVAIALAEAFECDVNELPLSMVLSWYEQKAVCILLTLLYLGIKNIHIGPTLPAFISPNVLNFLVENYGLSPISTPEEDIKKLLNK